MMPECYKYPERFRWFTVETTEGMKRTYAKNAYEAECKAIRNGYKVISVSGGKKWMKNL